MPDDFRSRLKTGPIEIVRDGLEAWERDVGRSRLTGTAKRTYVDHARSFVRYLEGMYVPGETVEDRQ